MNCTHPILVTDYFDHYSLITREAALTLIEKIICNPCNYIEVYFSNISYISRSFADQFHKEKIKLWESGQKEIIVMNAHNDVFEMLKTVSKTQKSENRAFEEYPVVHFESRRFLKQYLLAI